MAEPSYEELKARVAELEKQEAGGRSGELEFKVGEKGGVSVYRLSEPDTVTDATSEYRADQDVLQHFIDARCQMGPGKRVKGSALYASYKLWADITGEFIMSDRDFGNAMSDRGYLRYRTNSERGWEGIALTAEEDEQSEHVGETQSVFDELDVS